jgi:PST family polysaccharide transporter
MSQPPSRTWSLGRQAVRGTLWSAINNWGRQLVSLVVFAILARLLQPTDLGLFALAMVLMTVAQTMLEGGLTDALVQRAAFDRDHLDSAFWLNLLLATALAGLFVLSAGLCERLFHAPGLSRVIAATSGVLVLGTSGAIHQALLVRNLDFRRVALRTLAGIAAGGTVGVTLALNGFGVWALVGQYAADRLVGAALLWGSVPWRPRFRLSGHHVRELLPFTLSTTAARLTTVAYNQIDKPLVGYLGGPVALGLYAFAFRLYDSAVTLMANTISQVAFPLFSRLQDDPERMRGAFLKVSEAALAVTTPVLLAVSVLAPEIVTLVFSARWVLAGEVLQVLVLAGIAASFGSLVGAVIRGSGRADAFMSLMMGATVINLLLIALLMPRGLVTVVTAMTIRQFLFVPVNLLVLCRITGWRAGPIVARWIPVAVGVAGFFGARALALSALAGVETPWLAEATAAGVGVLAYGALLLLFGQRIIATCRQVVQVGLLRGRTAAG